jgi:hypothetical protein
MKKILIVPLLLLLGLIAGGASTYAGGVAGSADTATMAWSNPTLNTDGTALGDPITHVIVTCSAIVVGTTRSGCTLPPVSLVGAPVGYVANFTFANTAGGQICWTIAVEITHADLTTALSAQSNEACKLEAAAPKVPAQATGLTVK